ncbi:MAG: hypothetical protein JWO48_1653, partial [Bryobacterales bacterium]|nr:hypothetical protein [Bryobacterales bacterium]
MRRISLAAILVTACTGACGAATVQLREYPQKFRTFYQNNDPNVPEAVKRTPDQFPVGDVTCAATAADGALWLGTHEGAMRIDMSAGMEDRRQYFAGRRYLPDDNVLNITSDAARGVWVRTKTGVAHIELRPMTLEQKAAYFEQRIRDRHDRYGLVASSILRAPGDLLTNQLDP